MKIELPKNSGINSPNFTLGVATASFQIEGATDIDGRIESIWDRFCDTPGKVIDGDTGQTACNHYYLWEQDLDLIQSLGMDAYRFSIAWPRIESSPGVWNEKGLEFYEKLVDGLLQRGLKPYVTLYHWDLPQHYEDQGGWLNRSIVDHFVAYADKVTSRLGDKVVSYATFNEPWCSAFLGYRFGIHAPGKTGDANGFQAAHHLLLAHGSALPVMRANAPEANHGIVLNFTPAYPFSGKSEDIQAAAFCDDENSHSFIKPLMEGRLPESIGLRHPDWLPDIEPGDYEIISRPMDFLGINFYTRQVVKATSKLNFETVDQTNAEKTDIGWEIYPDALRQLLVDLHTAYKLPPIYITENGAAGGDSVNESGAVIDKQRCRYFNEHLNAVDQAMKSGVKVDGYFGWSLMDNFEWAEGYSKRFGLVFVDYVTQKRTLKSSALMFKNFLQQRT